MLFDVAEYWFIVHLVFEPTGAQSKHRCAHAIVQGFDLLDDAGNIQRVSRTVLASVRPPSASLASSGLTDLSSVVGDC